MTPEEILEALGDGHGYGQTRVEVTHEVITDEAKLEKLLDDWREAEGWIARQSGVDVYRTGVPRQGPALGAVVAAELARGAQSLALTRRTDGWNVTILTEEDTGEPCLFDETTHLTVHHGAIRYRRYWCLPDDGAAEVFAWRILGFEEVKE